VSQARDREEEGGESMNLILADRLFSDPRLRMLSERMKCPARAIGLLCWIWHGTQNMGGVVLDADQILATLPIGTRRDKRWIQILVDCNWLSELPVDDQSDTSDLPVGHQSPTSRLPVDDQSLAKRYRIVGNSDHVKARDNFVENGKRGAEKRWGYENSLPPSLPPSLPILNTNTGEAPPIALVEKASAEFDARGDEPKAVKPRTTRGFPEAAFEAEFKAAAGTTAVASFDALERSIGGALVMRCGVEKITQGQLIAEWWRPEWRVCGWTVRQLDKHFASVRAAIADPKMRPRPKRDAVNDPPPGYRPMPNDEENARMLAERSAPIDPKQFAEVSAMMREHVEKMR
jgi:hypothetical protein